MGQKEKERLREKERWRETEREREREREREQAGRPSAGVERGKVEAVLMPDGLSEKHHSLLIPF